MGKDLNKVSIPRTGDPKVERAFRDIVLAMLGQDRPYHAQIESVSDETANYRRALIQVRDKDGSPVVGRFLLLAWLTKPPASGGTQYGPTVDESDDPGTFTVDNDLVEQSQAMIALTDGTDATRNASLALRLLTTNSYGQAAIKISYSGAKSQLYVHVAALGRVDVKQIDFA